MSWVAAGLGLIRIPLDSHRKDDGSRCALHSWWLIAPKAAAQAHDSAAYVAVYFDQALPTNPGLALDAAIANFFAGKGSNSAIINSVSSSSGH